MPKEKRGPAIHEVYSESGRHVLEGLGLTQARDLLSGGFGDRVRETPHRRTERIQVQQGGELFLKLYDPGAGRIGKVSRGEAPARVEWHNAERLHAEGVSIPEFLCAVWSPEGDRAGSAILIQGVEAGRPLDRLLEEEGLSPERQDWMETSLLPMILDLHGKGYQHRDLYACHLLVRNLEPPVLIDLARVRHQDRLARRRRIKDLAALHFSLRSRLPEGYLEGWILRYGREAGLGPKSAALLNAVLRKSARIAAHRPRYDPFPL